MPHERKVGNDLLVYMVGVGMKKFLSHISRVYRVMRDRHCRQADSHCASRTSVLYL